MRENLSNVLKYLEYLLFRFFFHFYFPKYITVSEDYFDSLDNIYILLFYFYMIISTSLKGWYFTSIQRDTNGNVHCDTNFKQRESTVVYSGPNELNHTTLLKYKTAIKRNETGYYVVTLKIPKIGEVKNIAVITNQVPERRNTRTLFVEKPESSGDVTHTH